MGRIIGVRLERTEGAHAVSICIEDSPLSSHWEGIYSGDDSARAMLDYLAVEIDDPAPARRLLARLDIDDKRLVTPSNNAIKRMHKFAYRRLRDDLTSLVKAAMTRAGTIANEAPAHVVIHRYSSGELDADNASGGAKPLLDAIVLAGCAVDDKAAWMTHEIHQHKAKRGEKRMVVEVYER